MKKTLAIILLIFCVFQQSFAGGIDIEIQLTETPYKSGGKNGNSFEYIIGETESEYLALRGTIAFFSYDYKIARYDKSTMNLLEVKPLFPKDYIKKGGIKPTYSWGINQYADMFYYIFGYKSQKDDNITVYFQKLDAEGNTDGEPNQLVQADFLKGKAGYFNGSYSYDSSKFLSVYEVPTKGKENQQYSFNVFNISDLSVVNQKEVELPFMDKDVTLIEYDVDNEGNVYGLVKIFDKPEKGSKEKANYIYRIYGFMKGSEDVIEFDFENNTDKDVFLNSIILRIRNGVIYCSGFWGKKNAYNISGIYSLRLDAKNGSELAKDFYEFDDEFIKEFYTEKQAEKADKKGKELELAQIKMDHFVINDDGTAFVVGEQSYEYEVCVTTRNGTYCYWVYVRNDVIASKIDANGKILWATKIPKKSQYKNGVGPMSYHLQVKGNELYFIYYDHAENFGLVDPKKYDRVPVMFNKNTDLVCTKIDESGAKEKVLLYNYANKTMNQLKTFPYQLQSMNLTDAVGEGMIKGNKRVLTRFVIR